MEDGGECDVVDETVEIAESIDDVRGNIRRSPARLRGWGKIEASVSGGEGGGEMVVGPVCGTGDETFRS